MDQVNAFVNSMILKYPWISFVLAILGTLVVIGQFYVMHYASQSLRDKVMKIEGWPLVGDLLQFLTRFAPFTPSTPPAPADKPKV